MLHKLFNWLWIFNFLKQDTLNDETNNNQESFKKVNSGKCLTVLYPIIWTKTIKNKSTLKAININLYVSSSFRIWGWWINYPKLIAEKTNILGYAKTTCTRNCAHWISSVKDNKE